MKADISKLHLELLDESRQQFLSILVPFLKGYVLGGGTALSLQIAHRVSFDFDFFNQNPISRNFVERLSKKLAIKEVLVNSEDELTFLDAHNIKCTFLYYFFLNAYSILEFETGLHMFSIQDIAVKKAYTIGRRGVYRDYFDLYAIMKNSYMSLEEIIISAERVYQGVFNTKLFLEQLVYFKDLPDTDITFATKDTSVSPHVVQEYLEAEVKKYLKVELGKPVGTT